jgi:hypothetical protein
MLKSAVLSFIGLVAIAIAAAAVYLASGGTLEQLRGHGETAVEEAVVDAGPVLRSTPREIDDPDPDDLLCRGARYSTKGVPLEVMKIVGDDRCFPVAQLGEVRTNDKCGYGFYDGDLRAVDGSVLEDQGDECGVITTQDIRRRAMIYVDPEQRADLEQAFAADRRD